MTKIKVGIVSTNRADIGLLDSTLQETRHARGITWHLILSGDVLSSANKAVVKRVAAYGPSLRKVPISLKNKTNKDISQAFAEAFQKATKLYLKEKYTAVLITGDRFEMYAFALAAFFLKIKVLHLHAGEETLGAIDNVFRHSISLFADAHFCSTPSYARRVQELKKDAHQVRVVGAPSLDGLRDFEVMTKAQFEDYTKFNLDAPTALVTFHPETYAENLQGNLREFVKALESLKIKFIVTASNVDEGGDLYNQELKKFCTRDTKNRVFINSLGKLGYFSALKYVDVMLGNSSSGIIEAAAFKLPVVNVGRRQEGRYQTKNIFNAKNTRSSIQSAAKKALKTGKRNVSNPYVLRSRSAPLIVSGIVQALKGSK
ncbi:UDP-N-acetylglucosamine 2-epimerase [Bdellovibrio sp. HCB337]|uniref:UDP-N-acetylglucosamine 2-epimerase n=1 Tax=Bdellovibrio sp. HCB337 TaxID=3394358 RepID=UPI0039A56794